MVPQPLVQAFVVCRETFKSRRNGDLYLVSPFSGVNCSNFPMTIPLSVYAHLTDARGTYNITFQLMNDEGEISWESPGGPVFKELDPLMPHRIDITDMSVTFPKAGRYDLVLLANGVSLAHHALWARPS